MVTATCHNSVLMLPDGSVAGGIGVCESIDPDGDASVWYGEISPTFGYDGKIVAGTGKYEKLVGAQIAASVEAGRISSRVVVGRFAGQGRWRTPSAPEVRDGRSARGPADLS